MEYYKLLLCVILNRHFQTFFFSHIMLIESHVHKMKVALEKALANRNKHMVIEVTTHSSFSTSCT